MEANNKGQTEIDRMVERAKLEPGTKDLIGSSNKNEANIIDTLVAKNKGPSALDRLMGKGPRHVGFEKESDQELYISKLRAMHEKGRPPKPPEGVGVGAMHKLNRLQLKAQFDKIDTSGDGVVTFDELVDFLTSSGKKVGKEEVMDLMVEIDDNEDGFVEFPEFVEIFLKAPDTLPIGMRILVGALGYTITAAKTAVKTTAIRAAAERTGMAVGAMAAFAAMSMMKAIKP